MKSFPSPGFSLLEVLAALSLLAIATAIVLHLFPLAQRMKGTALHENRSTFLAQRIVSTLEASLPEGVIATAPDWRNNPSQCVRLPLDQPSEHYVAYDGQGRPQRELSKKEYEAPLEEKSLTEVACISVTTADQPPGMARIAIIISTPVTLPDKKRHHLEFSLLLSTNTSRRNEETVPLTLSEVKETK